DHPVQHLVARRWSPRAIDPAQPVSRQDLLTILEAARWAPSGGNSQPWTFLVFDRSDAAARAQAESVLAPGNAWAHAAPVLLLTIANERRANDGPNPWGAHDLGLATENLLLQATALGLVAHPMGGFDAARAQEL